MKKSFLLLPLFLVMNACGTPMVRGQIDDELPLEDSNISYSDWLIDTDVSALNVRAGESLEVRCLVSRAGDMLSGVSTSLMVSPAIESSSVEEVNGVYQFSATQTGSYIFQCQTSDGNVIDNQPTTVVVEAADAVAVTTSIETNQVQAGVPVDVNCQGFDAFGNLLPVQPAQTALDIDHRFEVSRGFAEEFVIRGTLVGDYAVACTIGEDVVDETPEPLTVIAGVAANSITTVSPSVLRPTETATITCAYTDLYGNPLENITRMVSVLPANGLNEEAEGITLDGNVFSGIRQGLYYAFCSTPGFYAGDESPAEIVVRPGLPYSWNVDMLEQDCYWQDRVIPVNYSIYDFWGNEVNEATVKTTVIPAEAAVIDDNGNIRLNREAEYSFVLEIISDIHEESSIEAYANSLRVDSTPPLIQFATPARAAMLQEGGFADHSVAVQGSISDVLSPIIHADLNGTSLEASGTASVLNFDASQVSPWGMSIITASSTDECGNVSTHAQSYLRSPQYFSASTSENDSVKAYKGIVARLNQPVIDDFNRSDLDDMASLGQAVLQGLDFNQLIAPGQAFVSDPITPSTCSWGQFTSDSGYFVGRDSDSSKVINASGPWINSLVANDNGIGFDIRVDSLSFPLDIWHGTIVCAGFGGVSPAYAAFKGIVGADTVKATGNLGVDADESGTSVTMDSFNLDLEGLYVDVDCGPFSWFCNGILNLIISPMTGLIENLLADVIQNEIPGVLEGILDGFQIDAGFELPEPINMALNINSGFDYSDFSSGVGGNGYGELGLGTQVFPSSQGGSIPANARGAIRKNGDAPSFSATDYEFGLGLKDDLLNQVMWALWYGGGLHFDNLVDFVLASSDGSTDEDFSDLISMSLRADLPPVIMPGDGDEEIKIGLGDIWVEASVDLIGLLGGEATESTLRVGMYLSAILEGNLDIISVSGPNGNTNELQVVLAENPEVHVQVVDIDDMGYQSLMSDMFTRVLKLILPRIFSSALGSFPLPEFDLTALAGDGLVPPGTVWQLTNGGLDRPNSSYYRLSGSLE